jgi:hypothetical protein
VTHRQNLKASSNNAEDNAIVSGPKPKTTMPFTVKRLNIACAECAELMNRL